MFSHILSLRLLYTGQFSTMHQLSFVCFYQMYTYNALNQCTRTQTHKQRDRKRETTYLVQINAQDNKHTPPNRATHTYTHVHTRTHTHTHARTHAHTHTYTHIETEKESHHSIYIMYNIFLREHIAIGQFVRCLNHEGIC